MLFFSFPVHVVTLPFKYLGELSFLEKGLIKDRCSNATPILCASAVTSPGYIGRRDRDPERVDRRVDARDDSWVPSNSPRDPTLA